MGLSMGWRLAWPSQLRFHSQKLPSDEAQLSGCGVPLKRSQFLGRRWRCLIFKKHWETGKGQDWDFVQENNSGNQSLQKIRTNSLHLNTSTKAINRIHKDLLSALFFLKASVFMLNPIWNDANGRAKLNFWPEQNQNPVVHTGLSKLFSANFVTAPATCLTCLDTFFWFVQKWGKTEEQKITSNSVEHVPKFHRKLGAVILHWWLSWHRSSNSLPVS